MGAMAIKQRVRITKIREDVGRSTVFLLSCLKQLRESPGGGQAFVVDEEELEERLIAYHGREEDFDKTGALLGFVLRMVSRGREGLIYLGRGINVTDIIRGNWENPVVIYRVDKYI